MRNKGGVVLAIFGAIFLAIGMVMGFLSIKSMEEAKGMLRWEEAQASLVSCELSVSRGKKSSGSSYRVEATYTYNFHGDEYTGSRVSLYSSHDKVGSFHHNLYRRLKQAADNGDAVSCWVNPRRPEDSILVRDPRAALTAINMLFVFAFGGFGLAIFLSGLFAALTPDTSSDDFMQNSIRMRDAGTHRVAVAVAVVWNLFALWMLVRSIQVFTPLDMPPYLWGASLSGLIPALVAAYHVFRMNKYGVSNFEMSPIPGVLGGPVAGNLRIPRPVKAAGGFEVQLQCVHQYTTRSAKKSQTHKEVLWDSTCIIDTVYNYGNEVVVPVSFRAPYNQPGTTVAGNRNGYYWQLKARAKTAGIDYSAVFDLPVKRTAQSCEEYADENDESEPEKKEQTFQGFIKTIGLGYKELANEVFVIEFPPARIASTVAGVLLVIALWTGGCVLMAGKVPHLFLALLVICDLFLVCGLLNMTCISIYLTVNETRKFLSIEKRFLSFLYSATKLTFNEMDLFEYERGFQAGSRVYYRVVGNLVGGKRVKIGGSLNSRNCAMRIANELNEILNEANRAKKVSGTLEELYGR